MSRSESQGCSTHTRSNILIDSHTEKWTCIPTFCLVNKAASAVGYTSAQQEERCKREQEQNGYPFWLHFHWGWIQRVKSNQSVTFVINVFWKRFLVTCLLSRKVEHPQWNNCSFCKHSFQAFSCFLFFFYKNPPNKTQNKQNSQAEKSYIWRSIKERGGRYTR